MCHKEKVMSEMIKLRQILDSMNLLPINEMKYPSDEFFDELTKELKQYISLDDRTILNAVKKYINWKMTEIKNSYM